MKVEKNLCDVCHNKAVLIGFRLTVIFTTDQTEGRNVDPYLSTERMDLCQKCQDFILKGNMLTGKGAMGHNTYTFNGTN